MIRWRLIDRQMVKRPGVVQRVEGPGVSWADPIFAPDRAAAEAKRPADTLTHHYSVVAEVSWQMMTVRERADLLAPAPPNPKDHPCNAEVPSDAP